MEQEKLLDEEKLKDNWDKYLKMAQKYRDETKETRERRSKKTLLTDVETIRNCLCILRMANVPFAFRAFALAIEAVVIEDVLEEVETILKTNEPNQDGKEQGEKE